MGRRTFTDGAQLVALGALHAGVDYFVGYPITPASGIFSAMIKGGVGIAAPDEITALQYLIGGSAAGRKAMTATSAPGFLLMAEGFGAALMMETPLTLVLVQRLGPATGSATMNAQGDVMLASGIVSGGFVPPVLCPSTVEECAEITALAVNVSETLRVPTIVLTEKEMVVGKRTIDLDKIVLPPVANRAVYDGRPEEFQPYGNLDERDVPPFRPVGDPDCQIRLTASTHDAAGFIKALDPKVRRNTERLMVSRHTELLPACRVDAQKGAEEAIVSYGFTNYAAAEAVRRLRAAGRRVTHVTVRTLFPVLADQIAAALEGTKRVVVPEENLSGQYCRVLLGEGLLRGQDVVRINRMGLCVTPEEIVAAFVGEAGEDAVKEVRP
ncbi:MAG: transketolase C-terminal domain-containing protein [Candidatus Polarisedimenticolia bacterium]